ncbi:MAG TPA: UDP-3-O-acyl-N-acetylglucosamine deacetylase [Desulfobacteraceae bacterium]|nr:UDP-3-O-acyl-N-acetylglucosamine deacetylase [Desulfobacteraceae bacterium]
MDHTQRTLKESVGCTGVGLHSGERVHLTIKPAASNTGIRFVRTDLPDRPSVRACFENVVDTTLATTLGVNGCRVCTVEHVLAALFGLGIDNAVIELDGAEVPIMDGSAAPFVFLLKSAGILQQSAPKNFIVIRKPFKVDDGARSVEIHPSRELKITYTIEFDHPLVRSQHFSLNFSGKDFVREISKARTFGFLKDVQMLKDNGFAKGGSLDNAVVIDDNHVLNEDGLRYKDEFVRHKILDFIGDLSVLGCPVIGHFVVNKSGHFLNHLMLREFKKATDHWKLLSVEHPETERRERFKVPAFWLPEPAAA